MEYKSKDKAYMNGLKKAVYHSMSDLPDISKEYAWNYIKKHLRLSDLRLFADELLKFKEGEVFTLGTGNFNSQVAVVTKEPITDDERDILDKSFAKLNIKDYYVTPLIKIPDRNSKELYTVLEAELTIIAPNVIIVLEKDVATGLNLDTEKFNVYATWYSLKECLESKDVKVKLNIWETLQKVTQHIA